MNTSASKVNKLNISHIKKMNNDYKGIVEQLFVFIHIPQSFFTINGPS